MSDQRRKLWYWAPLLFLGFGLSSGLRAQPADSPYMRLVPVAPQGTSAAPYPDGTILDPVNGTAYFPTVPQRVWLELRFGGWGNILLDGVPSRLDTWQATLDSPFPSGVRPPQIPCTSDAQCEEAVGISTVAPLGDPSVGCFDLTDLCFPLFQQAARPSFVFGGGVYACSFNFDDEFFACGGTNGLEAPVVDDGQEHYGMTVTLDFDASVRGTVIIRLDGDINGTFMIVSDDVPGPPVVNEIALPELLPAVIQFPDNPELGSCCTLDGCTDGLTENQCIDVGSGAVFRRGVLCLSACPVVTIPAASEWGLAILALLLLTGAKLYFGRRTAAA